MANETKINELPSGFKTWYQFYLEHKDVLGNSKFSNFEYLHIHPDKSFDRYEFLIDFIKARVFEEIKDLLIIKSELMDDYDKGFPTPLLIKKVYNLEALSKGFIVK